MHRSADIEGQLTLLPASDGGRTSDVTTGYRPHHRVLPDHQTTGIHEYPGRTAVQPGESVACRITFITPEAYPHSLVVGQIIEVAEGSRIVGHVTVTKILNALLDRASV